MSMRERINALLRATGRKGIDDLILWMETNGFYDAPCSSKYHLAKPGGLAEHSINVFSNALLMYEALCIKEGKQATFEKTHSIILCSLLHDLGKAGQFGKPNYISFAKHKNAFSQDSSNEEFNDFENVSIAYEINKDLLYVPHEIRSVVIASKFIDLTEEEQFAILYHNGLYGELKGFKGNEIPLYLILHNADMWAARVTEQEETQ